MKSPLLGVRAIVCVALCLLCTRLAAGYLAWDFELSGPSPKRALLREVDVEISTPSGRVLRLPAFPKSETRFSVRCFDEAPGHYSVVSVRENDRVLPLGSYSLKDPQEITSTAKESQAERFIGIRKTNTRHFSRGDAPFLPTGANLPWAFGDPAQHYRQNLEAFSKVGLNWARVWMAHWSGLNLEWPAGPHPTQELGTVNPDVAQTWDVIVDTAERNGVALQVVLQHHGQFSRGTDANWNDNPWNAANPGGFLKNPEDFFSDAQARLLTKAKYRYIVARWGYSPAIMSWELFNEIHNTEVYKDVRGGKALLAAWHSEMARYLRKVDVYHHLVTTSCEELEASLYQEMDYLQPHCYAANMLAGPRRLPAQLPGETRPVFYGEIGDDQVSVTEAERRSGESLLAPAWASAFGDAETPGQTWYVERLMDAGRLSELASVGKFLRQAELWKRTELSPFTASVLTKATVPWVVRPSVWWRHEKEVTVSFAPDGTEPNDLALLPKVLVGNWQGRRAGYPHAVTLHFDFPQETVLKITVEKGAPIGGRLLGALNGKTVFEKEWLPQGKEAEAKPEGPFAAQQPGVISLPLPAGPQELRLFNEGARDWIQLSQLELGRPQPALAALGKRNATFVMLWIWKRGATAASVIDGVVEVSDLPKGRWRLVRWDTTQGLPAGEEVFDHSGGTFSLPVSVSAAYTACFLEKE